MSDLGSGPSLYSSMPSDFGSTWMNDSVARS
jgi:hypothetical protein